MKHAGAAALDELGDLIAAIRAAATLTERKRGVFYRGREAALHFHEDKAGLFADWRVRRGDPDFTRFPVGAPAERAAFLALFTAAP